LVFQRDRAERKVLLAIARPGSTAARRVAEIWDTVATELKQLGVPVAALLVVLLATGCGYRFAAGAPLPEGVHEVYAPVFDNKTAEPGLEVVFTQAFREELVRYGVSGGEASEARVEG